MASESGNRTLGDFFELQRGTTYKSKLKGQPGPVLLGLASIHRNGGFRHDRLTTYGGESPEKLLVYPGELFVSLKDVTQAADLLGAVAMVPPEIEVGRLTQDTVKLISRSSDVPLDYLYWLLRAPQIRGLCKSWATGTTNLGLARDDFLSIPVPPLTQSRKRLTVLLGVLDDKIELNRKMNRTLEEMAQAIFKSWFIDFDGVPESEMVESELGLIPKGWAWSDLKSTLSVLETGNRPKGGIKDITEGIPSIGAESITGIGRFDFSKTRIIPLEFFESLRKGVLHDRDVLVYKDGGKPGDFRPHVSMFGDGFPFSRASINSHVYRLRTDGRVSQEFLYFWLSSNPMMMLMRRLGTGAAIPGIPRRNLLTIPVPVPDKDIAAAFQAVVVPTTTRIFRNAKESLVLSELRDSLLPKLISGEVRVPEAEKAVEAVA